jgi:Kelch motif.
MAMVIGAGGARFKKVSPAHIVFNPHWVGFAQLGIPRYGAGAFVYNNVLYVVGGMSRAGVSSAVERIDLETLTRSYGASMPEPRAHFAFGVVDGKLYVIGGIDRGSMPTNTIFVYDIVNNSWSTLTVTLPKKLRTVHQLS